MVRADWRAASVSILACFISTYYRVDVVLGCQKRSTSQTETSFSVSMVQEEDSRYKPNIMFKYMMFSASK